MKKNKSRFTESPKNRHGLNASSLRVIIVAACLLTCAAGFALLAGRISRAATPRQEAKVSADGLWQDVAESSIPNQSRDRQTGPKLYRTLRLNIDTLRQQLVNAPLEFTKEAKSNPLVLTMPLPNGTFSRFEIVESPMMETELAAKFPEITNYRGHGVDDPTASMRCDLTPEGFHAFIISTAGTFLVSPYAKGDTANYINYDLRDDPAESAFTCAVKEAGEKARQTSEPVRQIVSAGTLHIYRLAVAATAEYTAQNGGTVPTAFSAINTKVMGVNAIFEVEVSVHMNLIGGENAIIYTDLASNVGTLARPYTTQNLNNLIVENQNNLTTVIGPDNYDIGHVFDASNATGGAGGLATLATTCSNGTKGKGTSGGSSVLLTAHEMGHQFGASHTFNDNSSGSCFNFNGQNQRAAESAYEPGSGSTIMSYGGTCTTFGVGGAFVSTSDLQTFRNTYFHVKSLEQIIEYVDHGGGSVCDTEMANGNRVTTVFSILSYVIPSRTPFRLDAGPIADPDGDAVTYTWEEYDLGAASPPEVDDGSRPIFRSFAPSANTGRTFPSLTFILNNANNPPATYNCGTAAAPVTCIPGETLPTTTRTMMFQETTRDNHSNGGGVSSFVVPVNVRAESGPFVVTQPNTNIAWAQNTRKTVTWNVANTDSAPVSCSNVRITLSTDFGLTFPIELAHSTPNDGSETITLPNITTSSARIKVEAVGNIFFDISDADFSIGPPVVTNTNDSGPGSLRQAIIDANSSPSLSTITFSFAFGGVHRIDLFTGLPNITSPVVIDGWSQGGDGYNGPPLIELNGDNVPTPDAQGLHFGGGGSTLKGLAINRFKGYGVVFGELGNNVMEGCYIGTNATGDAVKGNGKGGVLIVNSPNNRLGSPTLLGQFTRNIIAGNGVGVEISGFSASGNSLYYNYIGTNADGVPLGNTSDGIRIFDSPNNIIGGTRSLSGGVIFVGTGNVISDNGSDGIEITGSSATGNTIQANYIGLKPEGTTALGNFISGIRIEGASNNHIGGTNAAGGNVISGNNNYGGIALIGSGSSGTTIQGNYLGTSIAGDAAVRNNSSDIYVESANNLIGGTAAGARNVISGAGAGVLLAFAGATGNVIQGNYIGTDSTGTVALNSTGEGISVRGTNNNTIGGTTAAARNIISGNGAGIHVAGGATNLLIQGNYIGTNPTGTAVVGNKFQGVYIEGSSSITIGGSVAGAGNLISGNSTAGGYHAITLSTASGNTVQGNFIGTNAAGTAALGNGGYGIVLVGPGGPPNNNLIGGTNALARNIISANSNDGILITAYGSGNIVQGNYIGTDVTGTANLGNGYSGIEIAGADNNTIGGIAAGAGNLIAFNGVVSSTLGDGVRVSSVTVDNVFHGAGNRIRGNSIFSNVRLGIDLVGGTEGSGLTSGVTANDPCDIDAGISAPNNLQNTPVLTSAASDGANTTLVGTLNSTASSSYNLDFYTSESCDPSGNGEGRTYLGSATVNTDASCNGDFSAVLPVGLAGDLTITATATDAAGNTSEFSHCVAATSSGGGVLAFNINAYDVPEGYNAATITVNRSGSSNVAVTVDYAVHDSSANQKADYSTASGTLSFAAGETSKSFTVLINDDSFVEGPEFIDLSLSNPTGGAALGANANGVAKLRIVDNDTVSPPTSNTIDDAQNFVYQHFHDFLAREPDAGGLAFWTGQVTQCGNNQTCLRAKRIDVSNAFFYELEYQQTGAYVFRLYRESFGNNQPSPNPDNSNQTESKKLPSYEVFSRDRARVVGGADLASGQLSTANAFAQRSDFLAKYPLSQDGPTFVDAVLATIKNDLGADLTSQRAALITIFNSGGRGAVLYRLADDNVQTNPINNRAFIDAEYNRAFVATQYFGYLRRDSDIGGFLFWLGQVNAAPLRDVNRQHAMVCSFITATEYQQRFSSVVTHSNAECQ